MIGVQPLSMQEFMSREPLPLHVLHDAVLEFLRGRADIALSGADAVNAYVRPVRLCEDVDVFALRACEVAGALRAYLAARFGIEVRARGEEWGAIPH